MVSDTTASEGGGASPVRSERLRHTFRIAGAYVGSSIAGGVLLIWPVVQPKLQEAGVFADCCGAGPTGSGCEAQNELLSSSYLLGSNLLVVASWPVGIAFDVLGPREAVALGSVLCCAGAVSLALTVRSPGSLSWLLFPAVVLSDLGSTLNSFGLYGFLWHFDGNQGTLAGLASSTYAVSSLLPLALVQSLPLSCVTWLMSGFAGASAALCWLCVPTSAEYCAEAERALGCPFQAPRFSFGPSLRACRSIFTLRFQDNLLFTLSLLCMFCCWQYQTSVAWPFLTALLGSEEASEEVNMLGTQLFGILSFVLAPLSGCISDRLGMKALVLSVTGMNVLTSPLVFGPSVSCQMLGVTLATILSLLQTTYYTRWFAAYAPPNHFGNFSGMVCTACGLSALLICSLLEVVSGAALSGLAHFTVPLGLLFTANVLSAVVFWWHIRGVELPDGTRDEYEYEAIPTRDADMLPACAPGDLQNASLEPSLGLQEVSKGVAALAGDASVAPPDSPDGQGRRLQLERAHSGHRGVWRCMDGLSVQLRALAAALPEALAGRQQVSPSPGASPPRGQSPLAAGQGTEPEAGQAAVSQVQVQRRAWGGHGQGQECFAGLLLVLHRRLGLWLGRSAGNGNVEPPGPGPAVREVAV